MAISDDIRDYIDGLTGLEIDIANSLASDIVAALPEAHGRVWHGHPVWFIDDNPIVGIALRKKGVYVLFWSGQSFAVPGLTATGSFKAAEFWPASIDYDHAKFATWLADARRVQWDYKSIRTNRGVLEKLTAF